ncbi:hypothetical protein, partial [Microbulbifer sp.]|uniref:hypothetical protein n=1 Tax=Microbulbifer sp. TaxID=1908541 RepID=UPI002F957ECE
RIFKQLSVTLGHHWGRVFYTSNLLKQVLFRRLFPLRNPYKSRSFEALTTSRRSREGRALYRAILTWQAVF